MDLCPLPAGLTVLPFASVPYDSGNRRTEAISGPWPASFLSFAIQETMYTLLFQGYINSCGCQQKNWNQTFLFPLKRDSELWLISYKNKQKRLNIHMHTPAKREIIPSVWHTMEEIKDTLP